MDHNLDDSLNLEGSMESMEFDHSGVVINQEDITLEDNDNVMRIELEEQQMLMDTGNEEIIVTDFMADQFMLQEYSIQDEQTPEPGAMVELNMNAENVIQSIPQVVAGQPKFITVKTAPKTTKRCDIGTLPKQVAIAPKPPKPAQGLQKATFASGKQYSIAPKPVQLVMNKNFKKVALTSAQVGKSDQIWTQIGKKLVMVPADSAQKLKLVATTKAVSTTQTSKPGMTKVLIQGDNAGISVVNSSAGTSTKLMPAISTTGGARYVMQQKTVPISFARNKVLVASPTKEGVRLAKKQIIAINSPGTNIAPAATQGATKKVVITSNPNINVIVKASAPPKLAQLSKDGSLVLQSPHTQLHQVNVPGKGIQLIRLVSNSSAQSKAPPPKPGSWGPSTVQASTITMPSGKSFLLSDGKGNLIQMSADKLVSSTPPPLIVTGNTATSTTERKLVRIAPVTSKAQTVTQTVRSSQSLLAPLVVTSSEANMDSSHSEIQQMEPNESMELVEIKMKPSDVDCIVKEEKDSKESLRMLMDDVMGREEEIHTTEEVDHDHGVYDKKEVYKEEHIGKMIKCEQTEDKEHPLIVVPSNFKPNQSMFSDTNDGVESEEDGVPISEDQVSPKVNVEAEITNYESPGTPQALSESGDMNVVAADLGLRARKACNCTKSQCLKLYCDCFANGEFCNQCNCNNCHNNLDNEELRQKAIRACLERNPYAFRPKIGKSKTGGYDVIRRHNKGCNCKRSGCLKNYCECYEAKIACTAMCKCVGCRNVEETLERRRDMRPREKFIDFRPPPVAQIKQPCSFMTSEVIEAVCHCLISAAVESEAGQRMEGENGERPVSPVRGVIEEFARCLNEIINASHVAVSPLHEDQEC